MPLCSCQHRATAERQWEYVRCPPKRCSESHEFCKSVAPTVPSRSNMCWKQLRRNNPRCARAKKNAASSQHDNKDTKGLRHSLAGYENCRTGAAHGIRISRELFPPHSLNKKETNGTSDQFCRRRDEQSRVIEVCRVVRCGKELRSNENSAIVGQP